MILDIVYFRISLILLIVVLKYACIGSSHYPVNCLLGALVAMSQCDMYLAACELHATCKRGRRAKDRGRVEWCNGEDYYCIGRTCRS